MKAANSRSVTSFFLRHFRHPDARNVGGRSRRVFTVPLRRLSPASEYVWATAILGVTTAVCAWLPISYHAVGEVYLLVVLATSLGVGRGPAVFTAIGSALIWNCVYIPPRFSLRILDLDDGMLLAIYFVVASVGSFWTARAREENAAQIAREKQASALLELTQTLASGNDFETSLRASVEKAVTLFEANVVVYWLDERGGFAARQIPGLFTFPPERVSPFLIGQEVVSFSIDQLRVTAAPILQTGAVTGWAVIFASADVSLSSSGLVLLRGFAIQLGAMQEREKLRLAAERQHVVDQSNRLHRALLDAVSHELNTPLSVLQSAAEELSEASGQDRPALISEIKSGVRRLNRLMTNLISRSRLEADLVQPHFDWCDVRDLFCEATVGADDLLRGHNVEVDVALNTPFVFADTALLEHVLTNLLVNAARHTPPGSTIRLEARADEVERCVRLSVKDTGPGVPGTLQPFLFDRFRRGPNALGNGLGLGLSIALQLTKQQGGELEYTDNPEGGACFTVIMPFVSAEPVPADE